MIDFHCHVDLYPNPVSVLDQAETKGVYLLAITTTPLAWDGMIALVGKRKRMNIAAGLHPELVGERFSELSLLERLLPRTKYVGEVGLDGSPKSRGSFQKQDEVFRRVLQECLRLGGRVISIHSRGAASGVLDALASHAGVGIPILHWFSGTQKELERAINLGCWFSVGPAMLASVKGRHLAEAMPLDRILTETDAPFTRDRFGPFMPWDVSKAEARLAEIWRIESKSLRNHLLNNLRQLVIQTESMMLDLPLDKAQ